MVDPKSKKERLILALFKKTSEGKIAWEDGADATSFIAQCIDYRVRLFKIGDAENVGLSIIDNYSFKLIDSFTNEDVHLNQFLMLYHDVKYQVEHSSVAIDSLLDQLEEKS
jgi:hypothetical protein